MFYFYQHIFVFCMYFGILSEMGARSGFHWEKSVIVMNGTRSESRPKEMKLKHRMPQILFVLGLSVKCKRYLCPTKNWWKS